MLVRPTLRWCRTLKGQARAASAANGLLHSSSTDVYSPPTPRERRGRAIGKRGSTSDSNSSAGMYVAAATAAAAAGSVGEMKVRRNARADKPKRCGSESGRHSGVTTWSLTTFRHVIGLDWLEPFRRRIYKCGGPDLYWRTRAIHRAFLRWCFTKRRYIKCTYLHLLHFFSVSFSAVQ